jgi:diguanylate cyclase (GGDEF)-like protein
VKGASEFFQYANLAVFSALTVACLVQWRRRANASIRWATAGFGSLTALGFIAVALQHLTTHLPVIWFVRGLLVALVLFPYLLFRFATSFRRPARWVALAAHLSTAVVVGASLLLPSIPLPRMPQPTWYELYRIAIVVQWSILFAISATTLWGGGRREARVTRARMSTLAFASTGMMGATLLSGVAQTEPRAVTVATAALFFVSAILFFVGLAPPAWLVELWRRPDEVATRVAMGGLFRAESHAELASVLLPRAAALVGARGTAFVLSSGELLARHGWTDDESEIGRLATHSPDGDPGGLHRLAMRTGTLFIWTSPYAPFFGPGEFAVIEGLGAFADIAMERCDLADRRAEAEQALVFQALHDSLTGLPNRVLFMDRLTQALTRLERHGGMLSVLFLDLDRFKLVNDTLDHLAGDILLEQVARRLIGAVRATDTVARFGGDEFVVLADGSGEEAAVALGHRLIEALTPPFPVEGREISVTASVGVVVTRDGKDPVHLLRDADVAMYRAKERGRARVELFDEEAQLATVDRLGMEQSLRQAIADRSLVLHYQPVVRLADGMVVGVEALMRWQHPSRGLLPPAAFIPVAEESDLIVELGTYAIRETLQQLQAWKPILPAGQEFVAWVNVSGAQAGRIDLPATVVGLLDAHHIEPSRLGLEITESVFAERSDALYATLGELRAIGVPIAIDDFGTGYSSMARLKTVPADVIKIDGSFVRGIARSREDTAIVKACLALADALDLKVVAECIETADQLDSLRRENCRFGQGYHFSRPLPADEATAYLGAHFAASLALEPR